MLLLFITTLSLYLSFYRIENIIITIIIYILITQSFIAKSSYLSNICMYVCIKLQPIVCEIASLWHKLVEARAISSAGTSLLLIGIIISATYLLSRNPPICPSGQTCLVGLCIPN